MPTNELLAEVQFLRERLKVAEDIEKRFPYVIEEMADLRRQLKKAMELLSQWKSYQERERERSFFYPTPLVDSTQAFLAKAKMKEEV